MPIKLMENFGSSIKQQEQPHIWLEFNDENGEILKFNLSDKIRGKLNAIWKASMNYRYVIKTFRKS